MVRSRGSRAVEEVEEAEAAAIGTSVQLYASAACVDMAKETDDTWGKPFELLLLI